MPGICKLVRDIINSKHKKTTISEFLQLLDMSNLKGGDYILDYPKIKVLSGGIIHLSNNMAKDLQKRDLGFVTTCLEATLPKKRICLIFLRNVQLIMFARL